MRGMFLIFKFFGRGVISISFIYISFFGGVLQFIIFWGVCVVPISNLTNVELLIIEQP